jgi:hypothetical protein
MGAFFIFNVIRKTEKRYYSFLGKFKISNPVVELMNHQLF